MRNKSIFLLTAAVGIIGANSLVLSPIAAEVARGLGVENAATVMIASAIYGLGVAASALTLAPRADRIGADKALGWALLVLCVSLFASAFSPNILVLATTQGIAGIGAGMALPATYSLAAQIAPPGKESQTMGTVLTGWTLSLVGGVTASAYIADFAGWRSVYLILAAGMALIAIAISRSQFEGISATGRSTSPITALKLPGVIPGLFAVACLGTGFYGFYNYLGAHLERELLLPISAAGPLTLSYGLGFALSIIFDRHLNKIGPRRGLAVTFSVLTVLYLIMAAWAMNYKILVGLMFVWGMVQHVGLNLTVGRLAAIDPTQRGAIMGLNSTMMYLAVFAATVVFKPLFEHFGIVGCAIAASVIVTFGAGEALFARLAATRKNAV
ncbi:MFS transporter [Cochlodiniinecator piscidefendens]|uniref:MFS transporter n=1 Tax=Cochlodiniinecator piscidefendens TaxID=2715756 RepID=UPI00140B9B6E|nr:MFS transporter [Cochlodiniinecator piscidefendens]